MLGQCGIRLVGVALSVILLFGIAPAAADDQAVGQPQPVPRVYVTENHGLMATFPPGLTYCPLPRDWVGSDHGTAVYLVPPTGCGASDAYASSSRAPESLVPTIGLFYEYNVVEISHKSGQFSPPRTPSEALKIYCSEPHTRAPSGITLLGVPAVGCLIEHGRSVEVSVVALYSVENETPGPADHVLIVSLTTTRDRLSDDLRVLNEISQDISVCTPDWARGTKGRSPCPRGVAGGRKLGVCADSTGDCSWQGQQFSFWPAV